MHTNHRLFLNFLIHHADLHRSNLKVVLQHRGQIFFDSLFLDEQQWHHIVHAVHQYVYDCDTVTNNAKMIHFSN